MTTYIVQIAYHDDEPESLNYVADRAAGLITTEDYDEALHFASEKEARKVAKRHNDAFENGLQVHPHNEDSQGVVPGERIARILD